MLLTSMIYFALDYGFFQLTGSLVYKGLGIRRIVPATLVYAFYPVAIRILAVKRPFSYVPPMILGFTVYGVYNLTNYATLPEWPLHRIVVDTTWGTLVTAILAVLESGACI